MTREDLRRTKEEAIKMFDRGLDVHQVSSALKIGLSTAYKYKTKSHSIKNTKREAILELVRAGMSDEDVAERISCNIQYVARCRLSLGINKDRLKTARTQLKRQQIIDYRKAHHSIKETAEHFNVGEQYVKQCCAGLFIGYASGESSAKTLEEREQEAKRQIEGRWKWAEYVDGYTNSEGMVNIRCRQCGSIVRKSFQCVRHYDENTTCPTCSKIHIRNTLRIKTYMTHWEAEERARIKKQPKPRKPHECHYGLHPCPVCGKITTRPKYCSSDCAKKASNAQHDVKKRKFMKDKVIDKDITLKKLFNRDRGVCWICGQMCDYGDYERKNGHFIAGNRYPSIDHIIPRCEGGEHSWANIKLAHRICNTDSFKWMRKDSTKRHIAV